MNGYYDQIVFQFAYFTLLYSFLIRIIPFAHSLHLNQHVIYLVRHQEFLRQEKLVTTVAESFYTIDAVEQRGL